MLKGSVSINSTDASVKIAKPNYPLSEQALIRHFLFYKLKKI